MLSLVLYLSFEFAAQAPVTCSVRPFHSKDYAIITYNDGSKRIISLEACK